MSVEAIELQLADLMRRVAQLEAATPPNPLESWKEIVGAAKDDHLFDEAMRLGAEWRARENQKDQ